jgi:hypothetical protein
LTFTGELIVWLGFCTAGLITSLLALRLAHLVVQAVKLESDDQDILDGTRHIRNVQLERAIGWAFLLLIGILAAAQEPAPAATVGSTSYIGTLIRWMLIGVIVLWSIKTITDYLFARKLWRRRSE